jgi:GTP pyrophosphokinase
VATVVEEGREALFALIGRVARHVDLDLVRRAHEFAATAHEGQKRLSGDPYILHSQAVAEEVVRLLEQRADSEIVSVALLHDVVEDTGITRETLEHAFGPRITALVDGVTKLSGLSFTNPEAHQAENFRKLILAMASDIRVILIKLCDRLHNMRTLGYLPPDRQRQVAMETRDIYAPLAHRLGIGRIRWEL